ncbi:hypothetical protein [Psychrobacter glacincola]|uniref:hypothetical protein n=1 Tax=Psychrobacter glacincola TaxID=56810 RepID=UPI0039B00BAA
MSKSDDVGIWLPIYIGEMLAMTIRFSTEQIGALYLLMMDYWKNGEVPHDDKIIAAITGLSPTKTKTFIKLLLSIQLFESNGELLFSSYLNDKKETATNNRRIKSERGKKAADARWGKNENSNSQNYKPAHDKSNAQGVSEPCSSNANAILEQCPSSSSLSSSNNSSLSHLNNNRLDIDPIKDWAAPKLNQTNTLLKNASSSAPVLDSKAYANHIKSFKTYYTEQELKNNPILTDDRRRDVFITWINNDRQYPPKNKKSKGEHYESASKTNQKNASGDAFDYATHYVEQG